MADKVKVTLVKSTIGAIPKQRANSTVRFLFDNNGIYC